MFSPIFSKVLLAHRYIVGNITPGHIGIYIFVLPHKNIYTLGLLHL